MHESIHTNGPIFSFGKVDMRDVPDDDNPKPPNIFELLRNDPKAAIAVITDAFRIAAAEGARSSKAARAALEKYGGDLSKTREFMTSGHPLLHDRTPKEVAEGSAEGLEEVLKIIDAELR
jgi:hypothetical protein